MTPEAAREAAGPRPGVRRNTAVHAAAGLAASVMALAWLDRASGSGAALDWLVCVLMTAIGLVQLVALVDGRTALLVADAQELRIRLGREWLGLPWNAVEQVVVERRDGLLHDGRVVVTARNLGSALESLEAGSRRHARWHRRWYGAPLAVPLSLATRGTARLEEELRSLSAGRTPVVGLRGRERARLDALEPVQHVRSELGRLVSRLGSGGHDLDGREPAAAPHGLAVPDPGEAVTETGGAFAPPPEAAPQPPRVDPVAAVRAARTVRRAEVVREDAARIAVPLPEPERVQHVEESAAGAVVFDDFSPRAVAEPVIGPEIARARLRAGLDVDELSARTMIRPHVLEAIEVDDFAPCGGDFYARGHLRTLGRYLGLDVADLEARYDERYAHGPINARQVFEAELATGIGGGMRATANGPRWSLLVGAVLVLLMAWGVARFFTVSPAQVSSPSPVVSDSAGLAANHHPITSELTRQRHLTVSAGERPARVVVRDRHGTVLWAGTLRPGGSHRLSGVAPFTVRSSDGAAASVRLGKKALGTVGASSEPATRKVG